jgi:peptidoglycan hydrolase CwlO-like protein
MKKILLILVLSLLAVGISFSVFVQGGQSSTVGGPAIHQEEDYWKEKYYELKAEYDRLVNIIVPQVEALGSRLDELKSELDKKALEIEERRAELASAEARIRVMESQLNTRTTLMYAFIVTTVIFVATTLYLALRRPKSRI